MSVIRGHPDDVCLEFAICSVFTKILCSLCTERYKPTLKYLARYTGLNSILTEWHNHSSVIDWLAWFGFFIVETCRPSCSYSLLAVYKLKEAGKLLIF